VSIASFLEEKRSDILKVAAIHGARNVRVFGSMAKGDAGPDSDVDLLVEFEPSRSLVDQVGLIQDLEDLLGRHVDVVEPEGLHWLIRENVLREAIPV
jgi:predicted nucleotidyltransferase